MLKRHTAHWIRPAELAGMAALALSLARGTLAAATCTPIAGRVTIQPLLPTACAWLVGIRSTGTLRGDLAGTLAFTGTSLEETMDSASTDESWLSCTLGTRRQRDRFSTIAL